MGAYGMGGKYAGGALLVVTAADEDRIVTAGGTETKCIVTDSEHVHSSDDSALGILAWRSGEALLCVVAEKRHLQRL